MLKKQEKKKQEWKMKDKKSTLENAGKENDRQDCKGGKSRKGK